jgi:UDP-glucose 4-epimerase
LKRFARKKEKFRIFSKASYFRCYSFAASKAVGESVENPLLYYENNINALVYVLQE